MATLTDFYPVVAGGSDLVIPYQDFRKIRTMRFSRPGSWDGVSNTFYSNSTPNKNIAVIDGTTYGYLYNPEEDELVSIEVYLMKNFAVDLVPNMVEAIAERVYGAELETLLTECWRLDCMGWVNWTEYDPVTGIITAPNHGLPNIQGSALQEFSLLIIPEGSMATGNQYLYGYLDENRLQVMESQVGVPYAGLASELVPGVRLFSHRMPSKINHPVFVDATSKNYLLIINFKSNNSILKTGG